MAKQRYIDTKFWDDKYIRSLEPNGKLLFLYLISNPLTTIAGAYEISEDRMVFDTKLTEIEIMAWLEKFEKDGKVTYRDGWVFVHNTIKHQVTTNAKVITGIIAVVLACPRWVIDKVCIAYDSLSHLNLDLDLNSDLNKNGGSRPPQPKAADLSQNEEKADPDWETGLKLLARSGLNEKQARPLLGRLERDHGKKLLAECIAATADENPADPKSFLIGALRHRSLLTKRNGQRNQLSYVDTDPNPDFEWPEPPPEIARRPPAETTKEEAAAWKQIKEHLQRRLNKDVYRTWFDPVYFDGIEVDGDIVRVKLRTGQVTKDWIGQYYSELLDAAVAEVLADGNVVIVWEIEGEGAPVFNTS